jgi:hypothetical protein
MLTFFRNFLESSINNKPPTPQREHPAIQNMEFLNFFSFFWAALWIRISITLCKVVLFVEVEKWKIIDLKVFVADPDP